jgi:hypothetical protein
VTHNNKRPNSAANSNFIYRNRWLFMGYFTALYQLRRLYSNSGEWVISVGKWKRSWAGAELTGTTMKIFAPNMAVLNSSPKGWEICFCRWRVLSKLWHKWNELVVWDLRFVSDRVLCSLYFRTLALSKCVAKPLKRRLPNFIPVITCCRHWTENWSVTVARASDQHK